MATLVQLILKKQGLSTTTGLRFLPGMWRERLGALTPSTPTAWKAMYPSLFALSREWMNEGPAAVEGSSLITQHHTLHIQWVWKKSRLVDIVMEPRKGKGCFCNHFIIFVQLLQTHNSEEEQRFYWSFRWHFWMQHKLYRGELNRNSSELLNGLARLFSVCVVVCKVVFTVLVLRS